MARVLETTPCTDTPTLGLRVACPGLAFRTNKALVAQSKCNR